MASFLVKEDGGHLLLETGPGALLLEQQPVETGNYLVQEPDGTSRFELEDGTGFLLLEQASPAPTPTGVQGGIIIPRRRYIIPSERLDQLEQDEAIALSLLLRTRKRLH